jgi:hypothetical protein
VGNGKAEEEVKKKEEGEYGWRVRKMIRKCKNTDYLPAVNLVIAAYKLGNASEYQLETYFLALTEGQMIGRRHAWQLWHYSCHAEDS